MIIPYYINSNGKIQLDLMHGFTILEAHYGILSGLYVGGQLKSITSRGKVV